MIPAPESRLVEHRLRVARADRLESHLADLALAQRQRGRAAATRRLRQFLGAALVALGARLAGAHSAAPVAAGADALGAGR